MMLGEPVLKSLESQELPNDEVLIPFDFGILQTDTQVDMPPAQSKVICIASGKGGTGKSTVTSNLAICLAKTGHRVLLLDADFGLANAHLLLGIQPEYDIADYFSHNKTLEEIIVEGSAGLHLIPGGQGISKLSNLQGYQIQALARDLTYLEHRYDYILVDLAAGISLQNMFLLRPAHEVILVINPEITSLMDAYALIKALANWHPDRNANNPLTVQIIVNRVRKPNEGKDALAKMNAVIKKHLKNISIHYYGSIPYDRYLLHSIEIQKPLVVSHPKAKVTEFILSIARQIHSNYLLWNEKQMGKQPVTSYFSILEKIAQNYDLE